MTVRSFLLALTIAFATSPSGAEGDDGPYSGETFLELCKEPAAAEPSVTTSELTSEVVYVLRLFGEDVRKKPAALAIVMALEAKYPCSSGD